MHKKNQILHIRTERDFLSQAQNPHIVNLYSAFQDEKFLYLEMEYCIGGDLMSQLIKKEIFSEDEARFYCAQIILAIEYVHSKKCIHRDIKPDNILIDKYGHVKLSDFGLSKILEKDLYKLDNSIQGQNYYASEVLLSPNNAKALTALSKLRKKRIVSFNFIHSLLTPRLGLLII